jgi:hypothetical protein
MRKLIFLAIVCTSLSLLLGSLITVRATTRVSSMYDVQPGMNIADVLAGLQGTYSIESADLDTTMRRYTIMGGPDHRYHYEIMTLNGKVASVWRNDTQPYSGDALVVGTELFDTLYAAAQPRRDKIGEAMGVRNVNVSVYLQKPASDSSSRTLIFNLPNEDFRLSFLNAPSGTSSLSIERVKSLDGKAFDKLYASPTSTK